MAPMEGVDSQVYALAQGNILVGGAGASAGGSSVQVNQLNGGRITNGAVIERELPSQFGVGNTLNLQLNDEDFSMAQQIADTINRVRYWGSIERFIEEEGVRDGIKRAEQQLLEMEERLGLAKRFRSVQEELTQICDHALQIEAENEKNGGDPVIRQNVESILRSAKKLTD